VIYGEGAAKAFIRLQLEIIKTSADQSIFAWRMVVFTKSHGILAEHPREFRHGDTIEYHPDEDLEYSQSYELTNIGLHIRLCLLPSYFGHMDRYSLDPLAFHESKNLPYGKDHVWAVLNCKSSFKSIRNGSIERGHVRILLKRIHNTQFVRVGDNINTQRGLDTTQIVPEKMKLPSSEPIYIKQFHMFQSDWSSRLPTGYPSIALPRSVTEDEEYSFHLYALSADSVAKDSGACSFSELTIDRVVGFYPRHGNNYTRAQFGHFLRFHWHDDDDEPMVACFVDHGKKLAFAIIACLYQSKLYAWIEPLSYEEKPDDVAVNYLAYAKKYGRKLKMVDGGSQELVSLSDEAGVKLSFRNGPKDRNGIRIFNARIDIQRRNLSEGKIMERQ
jgi:hypothetical protein